MMINQISFWSREGLSAPPETMVLLVHSCLFSELYAPFQKIKHPLNKSKDEQNFILSQ